ncbi:hypothetical protein [uncultured Campylobacter sp.]|uniref:hypothetical protein n=1 Tax=uncultured Campylobacter sp. TaxID=218934 RepID=UPI0026382316|nr:hypothetical protein [uncultured Campylobacter sp.]
MPFHSHLSLIAVRVVRRNFTAHLPSLFLFCSADEILSLRLQQAKFYLCDRAENEI